MTPLRVSRSIPLGLFALALGALTPLSAQAQTITQPGQHPNYAVEIEPHFDVDWEQTPGFADEGYGLGLRATIPFLDNGPISRINNNMGIGFGLDWVQSDDPCWRYYGFGDPRF